MRRCALESTIVSLFLPVALALLPSALFAQSGFGTGFQRSGTVPGTGAPVVSVYPNKVELVPGGGQVTVTPSGPGVSQITAVKILSNNQVDPLVEAFLHKPLRGVPVVVLQAKPRAAPGARQVKIWVGPANVSAILPLEILSVTVVDSSKKPLAQGAGAAIGASQLAGGRGTGAATGESAPTTPPNVTSFYPPGKGLAGSAITFGGQGIVNKFFEARIGGQVLEIAYRGAAGIVAKLPPKRMTGDLTVGYGNASSTRLLTSGFRVFQPEVADIQPRTFRKGDIVTVTGTDFHELDNATFSDNRISRIGDSADPPALGKDYLSASDWTTAEDGTRLTFKVSDVGSPGKVSDVGSPGSRAPRGSKTSPGPSSAVPVFISSYPKPSSLTGRIRFPIRSVVWVDPEKAATAYSLPTKTKSPDWSVAGPPVEWRGTPTFSLEGPRWGTQVPYNFIVDNSATTERDWSNTVTIRGEALDGATIWMNGKEITRKEIRKEDSGHYSGWFVPDPGATSDHVTVVKDGISVKSGYPLTIVPAPRMRDPSLTPSMIPINVEVVLDGSDLWNGSVPGLSYEFRMPGFAGCNIAMRVLSHTPDQIRFRIDATGTIPALCLSNRFYMDLILKHGGTERRYWSRPYQLSPPPPP